MRPSTRRSATEPHVLRAAEPFDSFYLREYPRMVAVVYGLTGQRWAAEELAQEALLRAYRSWRTVAKYDKPGAWLRRVTINMATSHLRRRLTEAKALALYALGLRSPLQQQPDDEALWIVVRSLPQRQREAFVLHYVDDLPVADIAEILEIGETTVKTHLQRARGAVQRELGGEVVTREP